MKDTSSYSTRLLLNTIRMLSAAVFVAFSSTAYTNAFSPIDIAHHQPPIRCLSMSTSIVDNNNPGNFKTFNATGTDRSGGIRTIFNLPVPPISPFERETSSHQKILQFPKGSDNPWEVHKFGGASLATADLYRTVGNLLIEESRGRTEDSVTNIPTMAIVSAKGGMTDLLVQVVDCALEDGDKAQQALEEAVSSQIDILMDVVPDQPYITDPIVARFRQDQQDIWSIVASLRMIRTVPAVSLEVVTGYGEIWSAQTLFAYLKTHPANIPTTWLDARDVLRVKSSGANSGLGEKGSAASTGRVCPVWDITFEKLSDWWNDQAEEELLGQVAKHQQAPSIDEVDFSKHPPIVVVTGYVARTEEGVPTTLKRSGSDYSATIFGKLIEAARVTMWKNTDGVYTADPRHVPEAFPIASLKYDEAMELAYFGAQVLHPSAMEPCIDKNIPVYVRNVFNPSFPGTVISGRCASLTEANALCRDKLNDPLSKADEGNNRESPIKGITSVDKISVVTLEGATLAGSNVASRALAALSRKQVSVMIVTQASSESSITIAVPQEQGARALAALQDAFELELARSAINSVSLTNNMAIVAIVGEGMAMTSGVASTFMGALARSHINIRIIAQGSSERQIAVVIDRADVSRALRAAHMAFTLSCTTASVAILGATGTDGRALVKQLQKQQATLIKDMEVDITVHLASCKTKMVAAKDSKGLGLELDRVREYLRSDDVGEPFDLDRVAEALEANINPLRIVVDCTNADETGDYYERWMKAGIHIISPGRHVGSGDYERYKRIKDARHGHTVEWFQSSGVGSALPILPAIQDLLETGDDIKMISGSMSETLAYVLNNFNETVPFSEAFRIAVERGYTEKDLSKDLSGEDTARKMVILARQIGLPVNLEDIQVDSLLPEMCSLEFDDESMMRELRCYDEPMLQRLQVAESKGCKLRYKFSIDKESGICKCGLEEVDSADPVHRLGCDENIVILETERYKTSPLIIKGAAAGPNLTAAAIFADILRLARAYSANQSR